MRRTFWGAIVFWALLGPGLLYAFMALATLPAVLLRVAIGSAAESPTGQVVMSALGLAMVATTIAMVWWVWRIYRGDPPREPKFPSKRALLTAGVLLTTWIVAIQFVERRGSSTTVDRPWLHEPVSFVYPYDAEIAGREAIVEVSLLINAAGEVERYEFTNEVDREFQSAVADAVRQMRINTNELGAESYPYEKRLRIPFVRR